jgi:hypothetical protein
MTGTGSDGFRLASGFSFARTLSSSARFAYIERSAVKVRRASGRAGRIVYVDERHSNACPLAWSVRGRTLFHAHDEIMRINHRVGIVDLQNRKVWMRAGHWTSVSWEPAPTR